VSHFKKASLPRWTSFRPGARGGSRKERAPYFPPVSLSNDLGTPNSAEAVSGIAGRQTDDLLAVNEPIHENFRLKVL
jgi:hypothetical protein